LRDSSDFVRVCFDAFHGDKEPEHLAPSDPKCAFLLVEFCQGLIPHLPWVTGYGIKFWIRSVTSSGKYLGKHTPHTG
jgi:hypothetical protein